jgi:hypothetical protein
MQENFEQIPEEMKEEYFELISQGFGDWNLKDYL